MRGCWIRKSIHASSTVEMAYMMPLFFLIFVCIVQLTFYFHDKNILYGAAYETVVVGAQRCRMGETKESELHALFKERLAGKLLLFKGASEDINMEKDTVSIKAIASKGKMVINTHVTANIIAPEKKIREVRNIRKAKDD